MQETTELKNEEGITMKTMQETWHRQVLISQITLLLIQNHQQSHSPLQTRKLTNGWHIVRRDLLFPLHQLLPPPSVHPSYPPPPPPPLLILLCCSLPFLFLVHSYSSATTLSIYFARIRLLSINVTFTFF